MNASEILNKSAETLNQRGADYDQPGGERSMSRIVDTFNALTGSELTEAQGWQFMVCLKLVRMGTAADPTDSAVDCAAYAALAGESLNADRQRSARNELALKQATKSVYFDGWISWSGGKCPVDEDVEVEYRQRNGIESECVASHLQWEHDDEGYDIVAYRVVND